MSDWGGTHKEVKANRKERRRPVALWEKLLFRLEGVLLTGAIFWIGFVVDNSVIMALNVGLFALWVCRGYMRSLARPPRPI